MAKNKTLTDILREVQGNSKMNELYDQELTRQGISGRAVNGKKAGRQKVANAHKYAALAAYNKYHGID